MRVGDAADTQRERIGVAGPPGIDRDLVIACLRDAGYDAYAVCASALQSGECCALVLLEPRERDWQGVHDCDLPVVLLCASPLTHGERAAAVLRGADALVSIDASLEDLVDAVRTVASGGSVFDPLVARTVARTIRRNNQTGSEFTQRELAIIEAIKQGHSVKETARRLDLSVRTVHAAQRSLFERIGAKNRAHALSLVYSPYGEAPGVARVSHPRSGEARQTRSG
jgi:DNA-binding CsgD family transcriptional regulator